MKTWRMKRDDVHVKGVAARKAEKARIKQVKEMTKSHTFIPVELLQPISDPEAEWKATNPTWFAQQEVKIREKKPRVKREMKRDDDEEVEFTVNSSQTSWKHDDFVSFEDRRMRMRGMKMRGLILWYIRTKQLTPEKTLWRDETSVILSSRRSRRLQWRTFKEKHVKSCIRWRWKGSSEFLFWECYSYDKKKLFHIWKAETAAEKRAAQREIDQIIDQSKPIVKENWELETGMRRMKVRNPSDRKPTWRWNERHGKIVRKGKGGIDWYRYQKGSVSSPLLRGWYYSHSMKCMGTANQTPPKSIRKSARGTAIQTSMGTGRAN